MQRFILHLVLAILTGALPTVSLAQAAPFLPTTTNTGPLSCFRAKTIADRQVDPSVSKQLVYAVGPRSDTQRTPTSWTFLYFDPKAHQQCVKVTVTDGAIKRIVEGYTDLHTFRLAAYKENEVIRPELLKIDSADALQILKNAAQIQSSEISSAVFDLRRSAVDETPIWKVTILADRNGHEVNIGYGTVSAATGQLYELKFNLFEIRTK